VEIAMTQLKRTGMFIALLGMGMLAIHDSEARSATAVQPAPAAPATTQPTPPAANPVGQTNANDNSVGQASPGSDTLGSTSPSAQTLGTSPSPESTGQTPAAPGTIGRTTQSVAAAAQQQDTDQSELWSERFERADENNDSVLSRDEMSSLGDRSLDFVAIDSDRNGSISENEWENQTGSAPPAVADAITTPKD
jgi:hypothetical protein